MWSLPKELLLIQPNSATWHLGLSLSLSPMCQLLPSVHYGLFNWMEDCEASFQKLHLPTSIGLLDHRVRVRFRAISSWIQMQAILELVVCCPRCKTTDLSLRQLDTLETRKELLHHKVEAIGSCAFHPAVATVPSWKAFYHPLRPWIVNLATELQGA